MAQWPGAEQHDNSDLYKRLLAAYSIPGEDRAVWLTDMADLYDGEPYAVVEAAVNLYTRQVKPEPREFVRVPAPAAFSEWVVAAQQAAEREQRLALPPPPPAYTAALTETEVKQVQWIKRWYAKTLARRRETEYLDERLFPEDRAWYERLKASEDRLGHIPDLPPELLKAALAANAGRVEDEE